jgi:hypothetical protein
VVKIDVKIKCDKYLEIKGIVYNTQTLQVLSETPDCDVITRGGL